MRGQTSWCKWLAAGSATFLAVIGVLSALTWSSLFELILSYQIILSPNMTGYNDWLAPAMPLYFDVYLFNWTNAENFPEEIPRLQELGPYRFREIRRHVNVSFFPNNGTVTYRTQRTWYWDNSSTGNLDDVVTTLNVVAAAAVHRNRYSSAMMQRLTGFSLAAYGHRLHVTKLARQLLFEGYDDLMMNMASKLPSIVTGDVPKMDKFGWFYTRNGSMDTDGTVVVSDGTRGGLLPGQIVSWNKLSSLPFYEGTCKEMKGSVGEFMPRNLTENDELVMFVGDLCRTVYMKYQYSGEIDGLQYQKYALTENSFDFAPNYYENTCFCNGPCLWSGVMNVSACRYDSPTFLSMPHFLYAGKNLTDLVHGLNPDPKKHQFYFGIEPKLGVPVDVAGRFQVNIYLEPNKNVAMFANVPRMLFPCLWVEQHVVVNATIRNELKKARAVLDWGGIVSACVALFFATLVGMVTCCVKKSEYIPAHDLIIYEKPNEKVKDECEQKLTLKGDFKIGS